MSNQLEENNFSQENVAVDYSQILEAIKQELNAEQNLFKLFGKGPQLIIDLDNLANRIAQKSLNNPLLEAEFHARVASINFSPEFGDRFPETIQAIQDTLANNLTNFLLAQNLTIPQLTANLLSNLSDFRNQTPQAKISLNYPFASISNLSQEMLEIKPKEKGSKSSLKFHRLAISVGQLSKLEENFTQGLHSYLETSLTPDDDDVEDLEEILQGQIVNNSDFNAFKNLVNKEVVGQLKKEASIKYLEYINDNIPEDKYPDVFYLRDLIRRLKQLKEYFTQADVPDDYYQVSYEGVNVDLKYSLSQGNAFECLPIIPLVSGFLGETNNPNQDSREFIFGLKLKLNNNVESSKGESVFDYHVNLINSKSKEHQEKLKGDKRETFINKVLSRFCVYFFVFASRCQPDGSDYHPSQELDYDPVPVFVREYLTTLKGDDEQKKRDLLARFSNGLLNKKFGIKNKITKLKQLLKNFLGHSTLVKPKEYPLHIEIYRGILKNNVAEILDSSSFFKDVVKQKQALRYISIGEAAVNPYALCQLTAKLTIEDIRYHQTSQEQKFSLEYDLTGIKVLPVLLVPKDDKTREKYEGLKNNKLINFIYDKSTTEKLSQSQYFYYRFTWFLLCYLCLKMIVDTTEENLFLPILRLHLQDKGKKNQALDIEKDMTDYSKVLAHILGLDHLANSQGLDVTSIKSFKQKNALNSLYSVIPKNFRFLNPEVTPTLDKLALIIVSSCECDARNKGDRTARISTLIAEVVTINLLPSGLVQVKTTKRLSANYPTEKMYRQPGIILDAVTSLYHQGYRQIIYLAKTPYTSHLYVSQEENIFLSKELIKYLYQDYQDLHLYPVFIEQYSVRKVKGNLEKALYLQDTSQLQKLLNDPSQQSVIFFNLFNGIAVREEDSFYNGVVSYATLVGVYEDLLDDQAIRQNLLYNQGCKNDLLQYLILFHFSRYEKTYQPSIKLNPYQQIISEESVAKRSLFKHPEGKADFNLLAFLTEVRRVIS